MRQNNDTTTGLFGSLWVQINTNDGGCPEDATEILDADPARNMSFRFVAPPASVDQNALRVYPSELDVVVKLAMTTFADLTFHDVALEILTYDFFLQSDPATNVSTFDELALWRVTRGVGSAVSMIISGPSGEPETVDLAGLNTTVQVIPPHRLRTQSLSQPCHSQNRPAPLFPVKS